MLQPREGRDARVIAMDACIAMESSEYHQW
jgi:hypothetical protein